MRSSSGSLESIDNRTEIENRIRRDFWSAFVAWEEAPVEQKAQAYLRLNNNIRNYTISWFAESFRKTCAGFRITCRQYLKK